MILWIFRTNVFSDQKYSDQKNRRKQSEQNIFRSFLINIFSSRKFFYRIFFSPNFFFEKNGTKKKISVAEQETISKCCSDLLIRLLKLQYDLARKWFHDSQTNMFFTDIVSDMSNRTFYLWGKRPATSHKVAEPLTQSNSTLKKKVWNHYCSSKEL